MKDLLIQDKNINSIRYVLQTNISKKYNIQIQNEYDEQIYESIQYTISTVKMTPPSNMTEEDYLLSLNKNIYDSVFYKISQNIDNKKKVEKNIKPVVQKKVKNDSKIDNMFDPILLRDYETPQFMDYPRADVTPRNIEMKKKELEDEREILQPKIKPISFAMDQSMNDKKDTTLKYNELLSTYGNFDIIQKNKNNEIDIEFQKIEQDLDERPFQRLIEPFQNNNLIETQTNNNIYQSTPLSSLSNDNRILNKSVNFPMNNISNNASNHAPNNSQNYGQSYAQTYPQNYSSFNNILNPEKIQENHIFIENNQNFRKNDGNILKNYFLLFDSKNRDLQLYPNPNSFQIKFSPNGNQFTYKTVYDIYNKVIMYEKNIIFGDGNSGNIQETFDNIYSIKCNTVIFPTIDTIIGNINSTNIIFDIFSKPYLYLDIPEIRGPYRGGDQSSYNSFSKLLIDYQSNYSNNKYKFIKLVKASEDENFLYDPILNGKLDKMTLNILDNNSIPYQLNMDKLYISSFSEGNDYTPTCGGITFKTTLCKIQMEHSEYAKYCSLYYSNGNCNIITNVSLIIGDLIYFYTTRPNLDQVAYLEKDIQIKEYDIVDNTIRLSLFYMNDNNQDIDVDIQSLFPLYFNSNEIHYLVINTYYLKIVGIDGKYFIVENKIPEELLDENLRIGITKSYLPGMTEPYLNSLFYKGGYYILNVNKNNNSIEFEINYPYSDTYYYPSEVFFIQDKLQINYNFEVIIKTKNFDPLSSQLNVSGSN